MLYKIVGIILSALFIATVQISTASAGCHGGGGGFHAYQSKAPSRVAAQQSRARKAALAQARAAKQKKAAQLARAEKKAETSKVAAAEPAPVKEETKTVAESTDVSETEVTVASATAPETCTRFNAQIGTTVTTDCAKQ